MFRFSLPEAQEVLLSVTDVSGKTVAALRTEAREGWNNLLWKGQSDAGAPLSPGVYFVRPENGIR